MKKTPLRLTEEEWGILETYCEQVKQSQNEVLYECVRRLKSKLKPGQNE